MGRMLSFRFVESGVEGGVSLNEENAPVTCETLWTALKKPARMLCLHAMFAGPEIMVGLPPEAQTFDPLAIPPENQTCIPAPGDCLWFYQPQNHMYGLTDELWEIGMFYAPGGRIFGPLGWSPCTIFGRMTENLDGFAVACADLRISGARTLEIGRA